MWVNMPGESKTQGHFILCPKCERNWVYTEDRKDIDSPPMCCLQGSEINHDYLSCDESSFNS